MDTHPPIRRKDRALPEAEALALLQTAEWGVLATADATGLPLATPLSFVLLDGALWFHCARQGHKLDNLAANPRVSFCVVGRTQPVYLTDFATYYESAVVNGRAALVEDGETKAKALRALCRKYLPDYMHLADAEIAADLVRTAVVRISLDRVTGKARRPQAEG